MLQTRAHEGLRVKSQHFRVGKHCPLYQALKVTVAVRCQKNTARNPREMMPNMHTTHLGSVAPKKDTTYNLCHTNKKTMQLFKTYRRSPCVPMVLQPIYKKPKEDHFATTLFQKRQTSNDQIQTQKWQQYSSHQIFIIIMHTIYLYMK